MAEFRILGLLRRALSSRQPTDPFASSAAMRAVRERRVAMGQQLLSLYGQVITPELAERHIIVEVEDPLGLHANPSIRLSAVAKLFPDCRISITGRKSQPDDQSDLRNIMHIMMIEGQVGDRLLVKIDGPRAAEARQALVAAIEQETDDFCRIGSVLSYVDLQARLYGAAIVKQASVPRVPVAEIEILPPGFYQGNSNGIDRIIPGKALVFDLDAEVAKGQAALPEWEGGKLIETRLFAEAVEEVRSYYEEDMRRLPEAKRTNSVFARNLAILDNIVASIHEMIVNDEVGTGKAMDIWLQANYPNDSLNRENTWNVIKDVLAVRYDILTRLISEADRVEGASLVFATSTLSNLIASRLVLLNERVRAVVTENLLRTDSHQAIILADADIPLVTNLQGILKKIKGAEIICVDSGEGVVILDVDSEAAKAYATQRIKELQVVIEAVREEGLENVRTMDDYAVKLQTNVDSVTAAFGFSVGLYRTEFDLIRNLLGRLRQEPPNLDELVEMYCTLLMASLEGESSRIVTLRTPDFNLGKMPAYLSADLLQQAGGEGFLLYRGEQEMSRFRELNYLFRLTVSAFMLAIVKVNQQFPGMISPRLMVPNISSADNFAVALSMIAEEKVKLGFPELNLPIGTMIETKGAVSEAKELARLAAFFSFGTNDLLQAFNPEEGERDSTHATVAARKIGPKLIKAMRDVALASQTNDIPISCCGRIAGEPRYAPLVVASGSSTLSVAQPQLKPIAYLLRRITIEPVKLLTEELAGLGTAPEVERVLSSRYQELLNGPWSAAKSLLPRIQMNRSLESIIELGRERFT
ncbi:MAG: putative PEP-binding protein [bacterium]